MQSYIVDIINDQAIKLLKDLELMQLIRVQKQNSELQAKIDWPGKYKGAMKKQSLDEIDAQFNNLRNSLED